MIDQMITWIDKHDGFMIFVATIIYAGFTLLLALQASRANKITKEALNAEQVSKEERRVENHIFHLFECVRMILNATNNDNLMRVPASTRKRGGIYALEALFESIETLPKEETCRTVSSQLDNLASSIYFTMKYIDEAKISSHLKQTHANILKPMFTPKSLRLLRFYAMKCINPEWGSTVPSTEFKELMRKYWSDINPEPIEFADS